MLEKISDRRVREKIRDAIDALCVCARCPGTINVNNGIFRFANVIFLSIRLARDACCASAHWLQLAESAIGASDAAGSGFRSGGGAGISASRG
jgi:hypothetical protein